jgi:hypothetical protein
MELHPQEVEAFLKPMGERQQLVYRLCLNGLSLRLRTNKVFADRLQTLIVQFGGEAATGKRRFGHDYPRGPKRWLAIFPDRELWA